MSSPRVVSAARRSVLGARYVGGQRIYLTCCDPRGRADVIVDNSMLDAPLVPGNRHRPARVTGA